MADKKDWKFVHDLAKDAEWTPGLREIFEYRDLGIKAGTKGDYVAHLIRHNGKKMKDEVQKWHIHECDFQFVYVMNGWATFEYEGQGQKTIRKGDTHPADAGDQAPRDRLLGGLRGAGDRVAGRLQDEGGRRAGGQGRGGGVGLLASSPSGGGSACERVRPEVRSSPASAGSGAGAASSGRGSWWASWCRRPRRRRCRRWSRPRGRAAR